MWSFDVFEKWRSLKTVNRIAYLLVFNASVFMFNFYLRQVNGVNGGYAVFVRRGSVCLCVRLCAAARSIRPVYKKTVLSQGNRAMPQLFFSV